MRALAKHPSWPIAILVASWVAAIFAGITLVARYKGTPGAEASAPEQWPDGSLVARATDRPTLVMLAHPRCPCTRASVGELRELMGRVGDHLRAYVLLLQPRGVGADWGNGDVRRSAEAIPGVRVIVDVGGVEAGRFGAKTSGQTLVYDRDGRLVFRGGITPARGHAGDTAGRDRIAALALGGLTAKGPVFGCALDDPERRKN